VQVDESGRHDLAGHVHIAPARPGRQARADGRDPAGRYGHVAHRVQARFGIDHPAAAQHQIPSVRRNLHRTSVLRTLLA
jgi:hypothetical protein